MPGSWNLEYGSIVRGVLKEDMALTVQRTGRLVIDVFCPSIFDNEDEYPLTHISEYDAILPLYEGTEVWVRFDHSDGETSLFPYLYKLCDQLLLPNDETEDSDGNRIGFVDAPFRRDLVMGSDDDADVHIDEGEYVSFPTTSSPTVSVRKFSKDSYQVTSDDFTIFYRKDKALLFNDDGIWLHAGANGTINLYSKAINYEAETFTENYDSVTFTAEQKYGIEADEISIVGHSKSQLEGDSDVVVKAGNSMKVDAEIFDFTGSMSKGSVTPTGSGVLCGIKVCPASGLPQVG